MKATIRFWGVKGSIASQASKFGSNTSCVELDLGDSNSIFFDAGTGIRAATHNRVFKNISLFISHFHWDHIQGLPFLNGLGKNDFKVSIYSGFEDIRERLQHLFDPRFHPVSLKDYESQLEIHRIAPGEKMELMGLQVETALLNHPGKSYAYKISGASSSFCYATDSDYDPIPDGASKLLRQTDFAVVDSQYLSGDFLEKADYGHASFQRAIDVCAEHRVKNGLLFHFDPNYSDAELENLDRQAKDYSQTKYSKDAPKILMSREGLEIPLNL